MNHRILSVAAIAVMSLSIAHAADPQDGDPATTLPASNASTTQPASKPAACVTKMEFLYETAPFPSCHASTIVETTSGKLLAAFFGGTRERDPDVGIWVTRLVDGKWTEVKEVANGMQPDGPRLPTWNPVLFQPKNRPLQLYYKIGPSPAKWWGMKMTSTDDGATWSKPEKLPDGILGPIKDKPIQLADGTILSPSSTENDGSKLHMERSSDGGDTWTKSDPLNDGATLRLIQPTLLDHGNGALQYLCRSKNDFIFEGWSTDSGKTWSEPKATTLPNPGSGIDAVQLADGRSLLAYNPSSTARVPLSLSISNDGKSWSDSIFIESTSDQSQLSYPAIIQTRDGLVHLTYTWKRKKIRHVVIDPKMIDASGK